MISVLVPCKETNSFTKMYLYLFLPPSPPPFSPSPARGTRTIKTVQLAENEVIGLCLKAREIFLGQPILLELEAPLKICGESLHSKVCGVVSAC